METAVGFGVFSVGGDSPRVGFRVGHGILDLVANGLGDVFEAPSLNPFLALGRSSWEDTVVRIGELVSGGADLVPLEDAALHMPFTVARLRRLLLLARACDEHRAPVPSGRRSAASELAPSPGRLPRPRRHRRAERDADRPPERAGERTGGRDAPLRAEPPSRHRARARLRRRCREPARGARAAHRRSAITCSASCSSTTGARATSRRGSTSRSGRSSASRSRPRSPPG